MCENSTNFIIIFNSRILAEFYHCNFTSVWKQHMHLFVIKFKYQSGDLNIRTEIHDVVWNIRTLQIIQPLWGQEVFAVFVNILNETLQWRHYGRDGVSNHQPHHCLLNRLFRRESKETSKFRVTGLCAGNSPVTGEFSAQRASNAENVSIWWRHHAPGVNDNMECHRTQAPVGI